MAANSAIEWTECTWNPVTGCSKVSPGCAHCYAERMSKRLQAMGHPNYRKGFEVAVHDSALGLPHHWSSPRVIFVNSMSDLFHPEVPVTFVQKVFQVMRACQRHVFQVLTKRPERCVELAPALSWSPNIWMGVSVESADFVHRIDHLRHLDAKVKFLSLEPLLGPINRLNLDGIDWVIVGGESGPGARPMSQGWVTDLRDKCVKKRVPFFFKQWGGTNKKQAGRDLDGRRWDQMPFSYAPPMGQARKPSPLVATA